MVCVKQRRLFCCWQIAQIRGNVLVLNSNYCTGLIFNIHLFRTVYNQSSNFGYWYWIYLLLSFVSLYNCFPMTTARKSCHIFVSFLVCLHNVGVRRFPADQNLSYSSVRYRLFQREWSGTPFPQGFVLLSTPRDVRLMSVSLKMFLLRSC